MKKTRDDITLTKAEMEIMNYLWELGENGGSVRDVLSQYPEPVPAYTTTATFLKILTEKGFVRSEKRENEGKTLFFVPTISRDAYRSRVMNEVKNNYFGGSFHSLVSFFIKEEKISPDEMKEIMKMVSSPPAPKGGGHPG
ncbi:MAG: BlaI/MecI/CopY family transcriptional regulator [Bacteroidaceae bacterium]|nr:BlaI/MecI/CopY family transcriptional regulator [Bacteroidaceae bacterium]